MGSGESRPMDLGGAVVHRLRPRRRFGDFAAAGKVTRRPQAAKLSCVHLFPNDSFKIENKTTPERRYVL